LWCASEPKALGSLSIGEDYDIIAIDLVNSVNLVLLWYFGDGFTGHMTQPTVS